MRINSTAQYRVQPKATSANRDENQVLHHENLVKMSLKLLTIAKFRKQISKIKDSQKTRLVLIIGCWLSLALNEHWMNIEWTNWKFTLKNVNLRNQFVSTI